jgi:hypothetical protein
VRFGPRFYLARGWDTAKVIVGFSATGYGTDQVSDPKYGGSTWWGNSFNGRGGIVNTKWWRNALQAGATRLFDSRAGTAWLTGTTSKDVPAVLFNGMSVQAGHKFCAVGEDSMTVKIKAAWIKRHGFGGFMYYDITGGYDPDYVKGIDQPLLYLMYREVIGVSRPFPSRLRQPRR